MTLFKNIERIRHIDFLIRTKSTGDPKEFAKKIGVSKRQMFNLVSELKEFGAPVHYSPVERTYYYTNRVEFVADFINIEHS
jgi:hypothetical protein